MAVRNFDELKQLNVNVAAVGAQTLNNLPLFRYYFLFLLGIYSLFLPNRGDMSS